MNSTKYYTCLVVLFLFISHLSLGKGVTVNGELKNPGKNSYVYLYRIVGLEMEKLDSARLNNGLFSFKFKNELPRGFYRVGVSEENSFVCILGVENIVMTADLNNVAGGAKIDKSKENEGYTIFLKKNNEYQQYLARLDKEAQGIMAKNGYNSENYSQEIKKLQLKLDSLNRDLNSFYKEIAKKYDGYFIGKLGSVFYTEDSTTRENFFRSSDFKDEELSRGDMLSSKISMYLQRFVEPNVEEYKQASNRILAMTLPGSLQREIVYSTFIKIFLPHDLATARSLAVAYEKEFPKSPFAQKYIKSIPKGAPAVGEEAPDIKLADPSGKVIALSSLKGKIVLLDFWASWCGPCRKENPNVVRAYDKFKDKGFTVYSVSLDNNKDNWTQAILKDGLKWEAHVSDLKGWQSSAAQLYGVRGIPATFLLDKEGKVVATNLRGESLVNMLETLCK
jgi:thiol-disulfide isomerase/thioredoxin